MTGEQIIKALEHCAKTEFISDCAKCEMFAFDCKDILIENALDLINRQKAEIKGLEETRYELACIIDEFREERNRLLQKLQYAQSEALMHAFSKFAGHSGYHGDTILCQLTCMAEGKETKSATPIDMNKIKSKAIKEFAKRLKEKVKMYNSEGVEEGDLIDDLLTVGETVEIIDNLVKEMTEKKDES